MASLDHAWLIVEKLEAEGIAATADPRSATPPCVLLTPPSMNFANMCGSADGEWQAFALSPTTANTDAWRALDKLIRACVNALPITRAEFVAYPLSADAPPLPAYRLIFEEGFDL